MSFIYCSDCGRISVFCSCDCEKKSQSLSGAVSEHIENNPEFWGLSNNENEEQNEQEEQQSNKSAEEHLVKGIKLLIEYFDRRSESMDKLIEKLDDTDIKNNN